MHTDLLAAGQIADPFVGDEEKRVQWVAERDWVYRRVFHVDPELLQAEQLCLVCDGLDTLAEVRFNGALVGSSDNMFRQFRWNIKHLLRAGENEVQVLFRSPVQYVTERQRQRPMIDVNDVIHGAPYLRKAPSHFGWDWGPKLPTIGIWREIRLEGYSTARLADVHIRQRHEHGQVTLTAAITAERWQQGSLQARMRLTAPDGEVQAASAALENDAATVAVEIAAPQLWWPNGYGSQPLYQVELVLADGETVVDRRSFQVGLRTIELRQEPDALGRSFTFVVNDVPIFAQGSNWIPADSFLTRISNAQLEHLLGSAAAAHHNMVRVWGGGYYEDEAFYDLCDRLGLLVWQDFMFACAVYPLNDAALLDTLKVEVSQNMRRLRHRACLALWCGNNEIETAWDSWGWDQPELTDLKAAYDHFFHELLPGWVAPVDPDTPYWASSPSSGTPFTDPNGGTAGDMHEWTVWQAMKPLKHYREITSRFVSEFGFQSLPNLATVASFAEPADWNMTSYIMEHHQRNGAGNGKMMTYLTDHFRLPNNFPALVYLTQLMQSEAMRIGVEHWRRHAACSGVLYWQLNDCWPVASWSSIDYAGRWKAAHYGSRRFFAPLLLSVEDSQDQMALFVTNAACTAWQGQLRWSLETVGGEQLEGGTVNVSTEPHITTPVHTLDVAGRLSDAQRRQLILVCELEQAGAPVQTVVTPFVPTKHVALEQPQIGVELEQSGSLWSIQLQAQSLARFVELAIEGVDTVFSDNYFDVPAGRAMRVTFALPEGWTGERVQQALRVRSLVDTY